MRTLGAIATGAFLGCLACGVDIHPGGTSGGTSTGGLCYVAPAFVTRGTLGRIFPVQDPSTQQYHYAQLNVSVSDYDVTCGGADRPPDYSAQNYFHALGFSVTPGAMSWTGSMTFPFPGSGTGNGPGFLSCAFIDGPGNGYPTNPLACLGSTYECQSGTVTVTAISPTSASGNYSLTLGGGVGSPISVSGNFEISSSCPSL